jgi:hypothetical protein
LLFTSIGIDRPQSAFSIREGIKNDFPIRNPASAFGQQDCIGRTLSFSRLSFEMTMPDRRSSLSVTSFIPSSLTLTPEYWLRSFEILCNTPSG